MTQPGLRPIHRFTIPADHPALPGHFPGRPVVPGVVLLDHIVEALLAARPSHRATELTAIKFLRPVGPGECVEILCNDHPGPVAFQCRVGDDEVARGTVVLADDEVVRGTVIHQ